MCDEGKDAGGDDQVEAPASEAERAEAEALRRALEGQPAGPALEEPLAVAGLLRFSRSEGRLSDAAARSIQQRLRTSRPGRPRGRPAWLWWLTPVLPAAAAAALWLRPGPPGLAAPPPSPALLQAQARAAPGGAGALGALERQMRGSRQGLYAQLTAPGDQR
jgi:hypothetical protein